MAIHRGVFRIREIGKNVSTRIKTASPNVVPNSSGRGPDGMSLRWGAVSYVAAELRSKLLVQRGAPRSYFAGVVV
ncbi:hypothetical protein Poly21_16540 [Allorhodopirellula heiligendammensis]|uniref:Uncharacterized protein n=1 Tax=Allorhodopirellula heiligendammensis TaxID=2714739 RepID=A0A5C6C7K4_9BACT|nr:hypothetical protein Poly21_16540 [Allorhodopirellula heiligendammensis]